MFLFSSKATYRWIPCYILLYIETGGLKIHSDVDIDQSTESMSDIIPSRSIPL